MEIMDMLECSLCDYKVREKIMLKMHIDSIHLGLGTGVNFDCPHCPYSSKQKGHLNRHINSKHEGKKNFQCTQCNYKAAEKRSLQKHIRSIHVDSIHLGLGVNFDCPRTVNTLQKKKGSWTDILILYMKAKTFLAHNAITRQQKSAIYLGTWDQSTMVTHFPASSATMK